MKTIRFIGITLALVMAFSKPSYSAVSGATKAAGELYQLFMLYPKMVEPKQKRALTDKINSYFFLEAIAIDAIKDHWSGMAPPQKKRYISLMTRLLEKSLYESLGEDLANKKTVLRFLGERKISPNRTIVLTQVTDTSKGFTINNDLGFNTNNKGAWKVRNVYIDGANLAEDYRSQFNKIVTQHSIDKGEQSLFARIDRATNQTNNYKKLVDSDSPKTPTTQKQSRPTLLE